MGIPVKDTMPMPMPMPPPGPMSGGGNTSTSASDMMMRMSFYWGKDAIILFSGWPKDSLGMYFLAFFFVLLIAAGAEVLPIFAAAIPGANNPLVGAVGRAAVHGVRMALAYLIMLAVMSFNLGIFIAAVAGHTIGFFVAKARSAPNTHQPDQYSIAPKV